MTISKRSKKLTKSARTDYGRRVRSVVNYETGELCVVAVLPHKGPKPRVLT